MNGRAPACIIGIDMGTTNTRAWLIADGTIVDTVRAPVGIRDAAIEGSAEVIRAALGRMVGELRHSSRAAGMPPPLAVAAAGMVTSDHGLAEVPHLPAPAGVAELSAAIRRHRWPELAEMDVLLVPGVRTGALEVPRERIASADVMRGEETLCVGLHAAGILPSGGTLLNLGSHWKVIQLDERGRVARSATALSGELLHAAQTRTLLAGSLPGSRPEQLDHGWARCGMEEAMRSGLERALFCVRLLEQRTDSTPQERLSFLVGAFVGSALPWLRREISAAATVVVTGSGPVAGLVAEALGDTSRDIRVLTPAQVEQGMARGLMLLTARHLEISVAPSFQTKRQGL